MNPWRLDQVLSNLFISDFESSCDIALLKLHNIKHVFNITYKSKPETIQNEYERNGILEHHFYVGDKPEENIIDIAREIHDIIIRDDDFKSECILVHCQSGKSRSVSVVIWHLMMLNNWEYEQARDFLLQKRSIINPNVGFQRQLIGIAKILREIEQENRNSIGL